MLVGILVLILSALIGIVLAKFLTIKSESRLELLLVVIGGYLVGITVFHMVPHLMEHAGLEGAHDHAHHHHGHDAHNHDQECASDPVSGWLITLFVGAGFFLHSLLDKLMGGSEHGHVHVHEGTKPVILLASICVHAFFEGGALMFTQSAAFLTAIALHKLPAGFALGTLIFYRYGKGLKSWLILLPFLASAPLGFLCGDQLIDGEFLGDTGMALIEATVIGTFLQVGVVVLWEKLKHQRITGVDLFLFIGAFGVAWITNALF